MTRQKQSHDATEWMQAVLASDGDLYEAVMRAGLQALMEAERDVHVGAAPFERGERRTAQRNGYKPRTLVTRVGTLELRVPQTRDGFYPSLLERDQRSEGVLMSALAECYVQGVSTRKVAAICEELFGDRLSHETVSQYVQRLDAELAPWRARKLEESFPYLILDARYEKARVDHRIVGVAVQVAIGVSAEGHRHVLGVDVAMGETKATWGEFLASLQERGLRGVELVVADAHAGLGEARRRHLPGVPWQRCQRHFLMNALGKVPKALEKELHQRLRRIWDDSEDHTEALAAWQELAMELADEHPELADWLEVEGQETLAEAKEPGGADLPEPGECAAARDRAFEGVARGLGDRPALPPYGGAPEARGGDGRGTGSGPAHSDEVGHAVRWKWTTDSRASGRGDRSEATLV